MILDTDFLIDLMNAEENAVRKTRKLDSQNIPQRIPIVVVYELYVGIGAVSTTEKEREKVKRIIKPRTISEVEIEVAKRAGEIEGRLQSEGQAIGAVDAMVGATALYYEEPVLTQNKDHFRRIQHLSTETY